MVKKILITLYLNVNLLDYYLIVTKKIIGFHILTPISEKIYNKRNNKLSSEKSYFSFDLKRLREIASKLNSTKCKDDSEIVLEALEKRHNWALHMFDASAKFPYGILSGNFYQLGNYDECLNIHFSTNHNSSIEGKYCLTDIDYSNKLSSDVKHNYTSNQSQVKNRINFDKKIYWAICIPATCTSAQVSFFIKEIFSLNYTKPTNISVQINEDHCQIKQSWPYTKNEIVYASCIFTFLIFVFFASLFHYYDIKNNEATLYETNSNQRWREIIHCFSVIRTTAHLLRTKPSKLNLDCLSGVKLISMVFIIATHCIFFAVGGPVLNTNFFEEAPIYIYNAFLTNSPLLVDTFLLISGFLMSYLLLKELVKRNGRINIVLLIIERYIRLTPAYLVIIGFYCTFLLRMGDGPLWYSKVKMEQERCLKSWWTNLLYVNNYFSTNILCMFQSWYLAVDFHLFIIAPFVLFPLWKWSTKGVIIAISATVISIIVPYWITYTQNLDPTLMAYAPELIDLTKNFYFKNTYIKTHMRASSYFIGLLFGYFLFKIESTVYKFSRKTLWIGWTVSLISGLFAMNSAIFFYYPFYEYNPFIAATYSALHRVLWSLAVGWVLIVCITDNASYVNAFLSWKLFLPLSRLTYAAYLINGIVEIYNFHIVRNSIYMSRVNIISQMISHNFMTFGTAFFLHIFFESPLLGLQKILLAKAGGHRKQNQNFIEKKLENKA